MMDEYSEVDALDDRVRDLERDLSDLRRQHESLVAALTLLVQAPLHGDDTIGALALGRAMVKCGLIS